MNYDISTYEFGDIDLAIASRKLETRDKMILILWLMGYSQQAIAGHIGRSRSLVSKRFRVIMAYLKAVLDDGFSEF